ncbi:hypothetical protein IWZ00DRAFT_327606 [Phyllosticta capitalensis]
MPPGSPLSEDSPTESSGIQERVRSILDENGRPESIYALPVPTPSPASSTRSRPRLLSRLNIFRRTRPPMSAKANAETESESVPRPSTDSNDSAWPIVPHQPAALQTRHGNAPRTPPAAEIRRQESSEHVDLEAAPMSIETQKEATRHTRPRKKRRRKKTTRFCGFRISPKRIKVVLIICSGLFLVAVAALYLSIGLTRRISRELHIVFILLIMAATMVFSHSSIRLCMLCRAPHSSSSRRHNRQIPDPVEAVGPPSFNPRTPIRVHLARDEDMGADNSAAAAPRLSTTSPTAVYSFSTPPARQTFSAPTTPRPSVSPALGFAPPNFSRPNPRPPPPSYGVWRTSVPLDPNLLHWQRASSPPPLPNTLAISLPVSVSSTPQIGSLPHEQEYEQQPRKPQWQRGGASPARGLGRTSEQSSRGGSPNQQRRPGPRGISPPRETSPSRPPSYVSEDGISYIFDATPPPRPWPLPQFNQQRHPSPPDGGVGGRRPSYASPSPRSQAAFPLPLPQPQPQPLSFRPYQPGPPFPYPFPFPSYPPLPHPSFYPPSFPLQRSASVGTSLSHIHPAERKLYGGIGRVGEGGRYPQFTAFEDSPGEWIARRMRISGLRPEDVHPAYR